MLLMQFIKAKFMEAEVSANVNTTETGHLGLTDQEEDEIVAFLRTLSDGFWGGGSK